MEREIGALRSELAVHDGDSSPVVGMFRRYLELLERDGFLLRDRDRFEIRRLLRRAQGQVTSTAVFLAGVVATILGAGGACILMDYTAAALGPASFLAGVLVGAVIAGTVMRVGTRELESWTAHLADTAMASLNERLP
ncbi:hypothetical protein [Rhodococcus pseudokoreensis]|uniref:hypothetical protein n=1 Tax=Rhodococcus pseudokoreensis TaxID=2811421 RepID=UPI001F125C68|nr:hypothetical protein [Rhodococcus pseudokoreensis]